MSGTGSHGLGKVSKGSKGIGKRGGRSRAATSLAATTSTTTTSTTMHSSASAPVGIPPLSTGRGRLGRPPAESHAAQPQQRVADIFLPPPGRSRPIEEKDADSVVEMMVGEQATIISGTETSTPTTTPVRSSRRPALHEEEEEESSSPAPVGNISSLSLSTLFTPNTARVFSAVVADFEEEMLMGTLGEDALDSQTVVTVKQPRQAAAEEEFGGSSSHQDLFEEGEDDDDDRVEDRDWVAGPGDHVSSSEEEDASVGLSRRISIADIASRSRSGRGMRDPQSASLESSATTTVSRTTTLQPPPTTTARPVAVPAVAAPSGRKGMFTSPIWQFFSLPSVDCKYATCNHCRKQLSRGTEATKYGTSSLVTHLAGKHFHEYEEFMKLKGAGAGSGKPTTARPSAAAAAATRPPPPPAAARVQKRTAPPPSATPAADTEACSDSQSSVASSAPSTASRASKKRRQTLLSETFQGVVKVLPPSSRRVRQLNGLLARAMCSQLLPYSLVQEGSDIRALLTCAAPDWRIPSRHFFSRTAIPALHRSVMANVGRGLDHAVGERVHVTMDSWSSRFGTGRYLSFTVHWVSLVEGGEEGTAASGTAAAATQWVVPPRRVRPGSCHPPPGTPAQTPRLSSSVKPRHCQALLELVSLGKTKLTASHVLAKLHEQERSWLTPRGLRVGEVVADNGANLVAAISRGDLTHIPCLAHVLNLVVQKFLRTYQGMGQLLDAARDVVRHFRRSPAAAASLEEVQKELHLPQHRMMIDVPTRWNSTLAMLERLVEQRHAVNHYLALATVSSMSATGRASHLPSIISTEDWGHMRQVCSVLAPFLQATNMVSRDHAMVCEWVPLVCLLDRALFALMEEGEAALDQQEQQAAAQASSEEEEELVEVPDLAADEGEQHSAAELVRGWREDEVQEAQEAVDEEDSTVGSGAADVPADVARLFPMAAHMLRCLRRDPRVIQMRHMEDIWISMMLDPRLKGKLSQFLPAGGDRAQQMRDLQRSLVERLEKAFPQLSTPTVQPAEKQQQVPAPTSKRTKDLLSLSHELYRHVELPGTREEVPAATSSSTHRQRLTRMVADYMGSFSGLDSEAPVDPMEYWVKRLEIWSELAQYALEVLSCPPSSVLSERCFSAAGGVVTEKRSRLSHKSVDRLTFLKMNQAWVEGDFLAPVVGERGT